MKTIHAVYENGVFRPKEPVCLISGSEVEVVMKDAMRETENETEAQTAAAAILQARFPNSFGIMPTEDADELRQIIDAEFGRVNPDDWR